MHMWLARQCTHTHIVTKMWTYNLFKCLHTWTNSVAHQHQLTCSACGGLQGHSDWRHYRLHVWTNYHNLTSTDHRNHENLLLNLKIPWRKHFSSFLINCNPWCAFLAGQYMEKSLEHDSTAHGYFAHLHVVSESVKGSWMFCFGLW